MLSQEVGWIDFARNLAQVDAPAPNRLLDPQGLCIQVAEFPQSLARADSNCSATVGPYPDLELTPEVSHEGLESQSHARRSHGAVELRFAGGQADLGLRRAPGFDAVGPDHGHAT